VKHSSEETNRSENLIPNFVKFAVVGEWRNILYPAVSVCFICVSSINTDNKGIICIYYGWGIKKRVIDVNLLEVNPEKGSGFPGLR
jgi:hypothetical protein